MATNDKNTNTNTNTDEGNVIFSLPVTDKHFSAMSRRHENRVSLEFSEYKGVLTLKLSNEFLKDGEYHRCAKDANFRISSLEEYDALIAALVKGRKDKRLKLPETIEVTKSMPVPKKDEVLAENAELKAEIAKLKAERETFASKLGITVEKMQEVVGETLEVSAPATQDTDIMSELLEQVA